MLMLKLFSAEFTVEFGDLIGSKLTVKFGEINLPLNLILRTRREDGIGKDACRNASIVWLRLYSTGSPTIADASGVDQTASLSD